MQPWDSLHCMCMFTRNIPLSTIPCIKDLLPLLNNQLRTIIVVVSCIVVLEVRPLQWCMQRLLPRSRRVGGRRMMSELPEPLRGICLLWVRYSSVVGSMAEKNAHIVAYLWSGLCPSKCWPVAWHIVQPGSPRRKGSGRWEQTC
jgi:hypothetical protein